MPDHRRIILTGASGFLGKALSSALVARGYEVAPLRSRHRGPGGMETASDFIDLAYLEGAHGVIHLAGEPIAQRWSPAAMDRILRSRTEGTRLLARALGRLKQPPQVFLSMSGVGRYGIRRAETLTEHSRVSNEGFLGRVSEAWENAVQPAREAGIRTTCLRTGVVLAASGGALRLMLPAFRLGLGGPLGGGLQQMSWIRLGDLVSMLGWCLETPDPPAILNAVSPTPCSQREFATALGKLLHRPACLPTPSWVVRLLFGQMGVETVLSDLRAIPEAALAGGFRFNTPELAGALAAALRE